MRYKMCSRCKKMIPLDNRNEFCNECNRERRKEREKMKADKGINPNDIYNKGRYKKARQQCMVNAGELCEVCYYYGVRTLAKHCHHIIKVVHGNDMTHYDPNNLVAVCLKCHDKVEGLSKEELIKRLENGDLKD